MRDATAFVCHDCGVLFVEGVRCLFWKFSDKQCVNMFGRSLPILTHMWWLLRRYKPQKSSKEDTE